MLPFFFLLLLIGFYSFSQDSLPGEPQSFAELHNQLIEVHERSQKQREDFAHLYLVCQFNSIESSEKFAKIPAGLYIQNLGPQGTEEVIKLLESKIRWLDNSELPTDRCEQLKEVVLALSGKM